jgi:pimeloyl-ACP methyl ester carboxylesterase
MTSHFHDVGGIRIHYLADRGGEPTLLFLPGLSATADMMVKVIRSGLSPKFRCLAMDLRGRGQSDAPPAGLDPSEPARNYTMADHAGDVLGLLDALGILQPVLVGHSFGGMLALYLASNFPERFPRIVVLDAAVALATPTVRDLLRPMLERLGAVAPSWDAYLEAVKNLPYLRDGWDPSIEGYFRAYVEIDAAGRVRQRVDPEAIQAAIEGVLAEDWPSIVRSIHQHVILINAMDPYGPPGSPPFLPGNDAVATLELLPRVKGTIVPVRGNHITMLFGDHAEEVAEAIDSIVTVMAIGESWADERE